MISKIYGKTTWTTNNCNTHNCPIFQEGRDNQTIKFGQLIECNMRNIFLEKSYTKYGGETSPRPSSKKISGSIV